MFRSLRERVDQRVGRVKSDVAVGYQRRIEDYKRPGLVALLGAAQVAGAVAVAVVALFLAENTYSRVGIVAVCALFGYRGLQICLRGIATMRLAPLLDGSSSVPERSDMATVDLVRSSPAGNAPPFRPRVVEVDIAARERGDSSWPNCRRRRRRLPTPSQICPGWRLGRKTGSAAPGRQVRGKLPHRASPGADAVGVRP